MSRKARDKRDVSRKCLLFFLCVYIVYISPPSVESNGREAAEAVEKLKYTVTF